MYVGDKIKAVEEHKETYGDKVFTVSQQSPLQVAELPNVNLESSHFVLAKKVSRVWATPDK